MTNFERLPPHKQRAVLYEVTGKHTRQQIAEYVGVESGATITSWRKDPVYQAAVQEKMAEISMAATEFYLKDYKFFAKGLSAELITRINEGRLGDLETDKLIKSLHLLVKHVTDMEALENEPSGDDKDVDANPFEKMRRRLQKKVRAEEDDEEKH